MPSSSKSQERTMKAAAHNRGFAAKLDIPQHVAREFATADKVRAAGKRKRKQARTKS